MLAVLARRPVTPLSLSKLPSMSMPTRDMEPGAMRAATMVTMMGKMIFSRWVTMRGGFMWMRASAGEIITFMMGG